MASQNTTDFDYIVIGSGIGGCVVASRLSEDPAVRVLLLEAGPEDNDSDIHATELTSLFAVWSKPQFDVGAEHGGGAWARTAARCRSSRARLPAAARRCIGRIFIRGHRRDFDHWNYMGNEGWAFDQVLPYFKKLEDYMGPASEYPRRRRADAVMDLPAERRSVAAQAFVAGCKGTRVRKRLGLQRSEAGGWRRLHSDHDDEGLQARQRVFAVTSRRMSAVART